MATDRDDAAEHQKVRDELDALTNVFDRVFGGSGDGAKANDAVTTTFPAADKADAGSGVEGGATGAADAGASDAEGSPANRSEEAGEPSPILPGMDICDLGAVQAMLGTVRRSSTSWDVSNRNRDLLRDLVKKGARRCLHPIDAAWRTAFDALEAIYPHFALLFAYLRGACAIAERGDRTLITDPLLVTGAPGTGKSTLLEMLARILARTYRRVSMSTAQSNSLLAGSETYWANSETGAIFNLLVDGQDANPVVLLDELDKVQGDMRYDPLGPLYTLLEPAQASRWVDASMPGLEVDASRIIWFATSNEARLIPDPILQRFIVVTIPEPTKDQCRAIVRSVDAQLKLRDERLRGIDVGESAVESLAGLAPREVRKRLRFAYGNVAYRGGFRIDANDVDLRGALRPGSIGF